MRRKPLKLLLSLSVIMIPISAPLTIHAMVDGRGPVLTAPTRSNNAIHAVGRRAVHRRKVRASPTELGLAAAARSIGVTVRELRAQWQSVANCEVGGNWAMTGPVYSGIGFSNATWSAFGGGHYARLAGQATPDQQILIGMRVTHGWIPDQTGCASW
ncbi:MAG: transglycosylase family protein [Acidimicrobiales bacterium]